MSRTAAGFSGKLVCIFVPLLKARRLCRSSKMRYITAVQVHYRNALQPCSAFPCGVACFQAANFVLDLPSIGTAEGDGGSGSSSAAALHATINRLPSTFFDWSLPVFMSLYVLARENL